MRRRGVLVGMAIMLAALNLRAPVASVGPVLPEIRAGLRLTGTGAAVLTTLPVVCFGVLAVVAPRWARRFGIEAVLMLALIMLTLGLAGRAWAGTGELLAGTVVVGGSIAIANVLLPPLIKREFAGGTGLMMGLYTMCMATSAAIGAGLTVPAGEQLHLGWRGSLWMWCLPAALAAGMWLPMLERGTPQPARKQPVYGPSVTRFPLAWQVTIYFGLQSLVFYAMLAWLPSLYRDLGYSPAAAGFLLSLCGLVQIPVTLLLPRFAIRARNQVPHIVGSTAFMGAGLAGILVAPTLAPYLWVTLLGIGCGACFAMGLALFVLRTNQVEDTARLSAMAQSIGYLICACGPLLFGLVHDRTGGWAVPLLLLLGLLLPQLACGVLAGRSRQLCLAPIPLMTDAARRLLAAGAAPATVPWPPAPRAPAWASPPKGLTSVSPKHAPTWASLLPAAQPSASASHAPAWAAPQPAALPWAPPSHALEWVSRQPAALPWAQPLLALPSAPSQPAALPAASEAQPPARRTAS